jgi:hypothetical protein
MTATPISDLRHLNTTAAAHALDCSRQRVLSLAARGLLTPVPVAGKVFFKLDEVRALRARLARSARRAR